MVSKFPPAVLRSALLFAVSLLLLPFLAQGQDITVAYGTPVNVVAYSSYGASIYTSCGANFGSTCQVGNAPPNGNISWTLDGNPVSSSYDTTDDDSYTCQIPDDNNTPRDQQCDSYIDESGYSGTLSVGSHTLTAFLPPSQDSNAAFSQTWTIQVTASSVATSLTLACNPNPISNGQTSDCTATVSPAATGTVSFTLVGNTTVVALDGNSHALLARQFQGAPANTYTLYASYSGDSSHQTSSTSTNVEVEPATGGTNPSSSIVGPSNYIRCANENGTCSLPGWAQVAFGINGSYTYVPFASGSVTCNTATFGDPAQGQVKACFYSLSNGNALLPPSGYTLCSLQGEDCIFTGTADIAYGFVDSKYGHTGGFTVQSKTNGTSCSDNAFGDPAPGLIKACYYKPNSGNQPSGPSGYIYCGDEYGYCVTAGGFSQIAYGANGTFNYVPFNGGTIACSDGTLGDPTPGTVKECFYSKSNGLPLLGPQNYAFCALEAENCSFSGAGTIAYGYNGHFTTASASDGLACNDSLGDAAPGLIKACYYAPAGSPVPISLNLSCSPNPLPSGQTADCTATVTPVVAGNITFTIAGNTTVVPLDGSGKAVLAGQFQGAPANTYTVTASYSGDAGHAAVSAGTGVQVGGGFSSNAPHIDSLSLKEGPVGMGIVITGEHFGASEGSSTIQLNGVNLVTASSSWSDGQIVAQISSGATTGNIVATVQGQASNGVNFQVDQAFQCVLP